MKVKELPELKVGTVVKSRIYNQQGVVSKIIEQIGKNGFLYHRFEVTWLDGKVTAAYRHENSFEVMFAPED